ncbi:MAG: hypothetical protein ACTHK2_17220 [Dokdonella sp.]|uniref:hypothetical protein n=1 Tax=Dokdonella sp. TaxID=2291710 RepID=UPI003F7E17FA
MTIADIQNALDDFFSTKGRHVMFTGAGVSAHADLPVWSTLLAGLAETLRKKDPLTQQQILKELAGRAQPVDATAALSLSAGVLKPKVSLGR